jgi:hypothetical protein
MRKLLATVIAIICLCFASTGAGQAKTADASSSRCDWIKAESSSGIRVAQIDHCCVGARRMPDDTTRCVYACNDMIDNCTGKMIRAGYPHIAFDGYTPEACIDFILNTPWCSP